MGFDYMTLITDRAQGDVDALKALLAQPMSQWTEDEKAALLSGGMKGSYDAADLNRVTACMEDIAARFRALGYSVPGYGRVKVASDSDGLTRYTWQNSDTPTDVQMAQYRANVAALRAVLAQAADTPDVPEDMAKLSYEAANAIEQVLAATDQLIVNLSKSWYYSGEVYAGEV